MAIQSAWLLADAMEAEVDPGAAARRYAREWRRHLAFRIRASQVFAAATMRPATSAISVALLRLLPPLLTLGALWSGKAHRITPEAAR